MRAAINYSSRGENRPDTTAYGLVLTLFAAWQVDIYHTGGVGSRRNTKIALKVINHGRMRNKI